MFKIKEGQGGCTPTPSHALFLKACLADTDAAIRLWQEWKKNNALDYIDEALFRQLPLLYHSLNAAGFDGPEMPVLKGVARRTWVLNQNVYRRTNELIDALGAAQIPVLLLKGLALSQFYYPAPHLRSMTDGDFMVLHAHVDAAIAILLRRGWRPLFPMPEGYIKKWHGCTFINEANEETDIHWDLFAGYKRNKELWHRSEPIYFYERPVRVLSPTDNLIHVCLHGYRWNPFHPLRWVADACMILKKARDRINWAVLIEEVSRQHMTLRALKSLGYLADEFRANIPRAVIKKLASIPISDAEKAECRKLTREDDAVAA